MTTVDTTRGRVQGWRDGSVFRFRGIPYAAPPIGELRFRHPVVHPGWTGVHDATHHGPASLQAGPSDKPIRGQEDCLYLDVCTPAADGARRPTMVWFHGGAFIQGAGWLAEYDGAPLSTQGDVVVVTCNYRLGALGWLHLADIDEEFGRDGNCGLFDQLAVLRWVRDNIERFGGDPANVTAFGQSAGAIGIATLATMPESEGLMHRAVSQSGGLNGLLDLDVARELTELVFESGGFRSVDQLLAATAEQILAAQQAAVTRTSRGAARNFAIQPLIVIGPTVDHQTIMARPLDVLSSGGARSIPLVAGANRDEWRYFSSVGPAADEPTIVERLSRWMPDGERVWEAYRAHSATVDDAWIDLQTDWLIRVPTVRLVEAWGGPARDAVFHYDFCWRPPGAEAGASHSREIPFVFDTFYEPRGRMLGGASPPRSLIDFMSGAWVAFAGSGDPTVGGAMTWPAYGTARRTMVLDAEPSVVADLDPEVREIWDGLL